jgi:hypothetical protein
MQHILVESERLLIRCPKDEDRQTLERVFCDPGMMYYIFHAMQPLYLHNFFLAMGEIL